MGLIEFEATEINVSRLTGDAPRLGFEPRTLKLTAFCSTVELSRNIMAILAFRVWEI